MPVRYPPSPRGDAVDDYHGTRIADPYRWLENLDSPATQAWVDAQNACTLPYLEALPQRAPLLARLTQLWNYPRTGLPRAVGGRLYYRRNTGLEKQAPLYRRAAHDAPPSLLLDPNALSADGSVSLADWQPSPDGRLLAYALAQGGADWAEVRVRDLATGADLPDVVRWFRFSTIAWTKDSGGFFYGRFPAPPAGKALEAGLRDHQVHYHRVGTAQDEDVLVYRRPDLPHYFVGASVTDDGRYLLVTLGNGTDPRNRLLVADLRDPQVPDVAAPVEAIVDEDLAELTVLGSEGTVLYVRTDLRAPNRRIVAIDVARRDAPDGWASIVPECAEPLEDAVLAGGRLFCHYLVDVASRVRIHTLSGAPDGALDLPAIASVAGMSGRERGSEVFYEVSTPLAPPAVFRYDVATRATTPFDAVPPAFDPSPYETRRVVYRSRDGTRVPMHVTARRGLVRDGSHPVWLYGYGGFAITQPPAYRPDLAAWLEMGGVFALPALRGGAEYGEAWHRAGMLERKQNVFDDFIAAADSLIAEKYTAPDRLVIEGRSNGGLLVGAALTQRPELFAVAIAAVGVLDMLRFDLFTCGAAWTAEYGSARDEDAFAWLIRYSPLHNVKPGTRYPATLVTTADHDDRVVPSHSYKFAAALQAAQAGDQPVLIRVERQGSHAYRPTDRQIAERADVLAFAADRLGLRLPG